MLLSARTARCAGAGALGAGAVAGAMLFGTVPSALADPPPHRPQGAQRQISNKSPPKSRRRPPATCSAIPTSMPTSPVSGANPGIRFVAKLRPTWRTTRRRSPSWPVSASPYTI
jgi:hypothetical protein